MEIDLIGSTSPCSLTGAGKAGPVVDHTQTPASGRGAPPLPSCSGTSTTGTTSDSAPCSGTGVGGLWVGWGQEPLHTRLPLLGAPQKKGEERYLPVTRAIRADPCPATEIRRYGKSVPGEGSEKVRE